VDGIKSKRADVTKQALRQTSFYQRLDQRAATNQDPDLSSEPLFDPPAKILPASVKSTRWDLPLLQSPLQYVPAQVFPETMLRKSPVIIPTDGSTGRDPRNFKRSPSTKRTLAQIVSPVRKRVSPPPPLKQSGLILELFGSSDDERDLENQGSGLSEEPRTPISDASDGDESDSSSSSGTTVTSLADSDHDVPTDSPCEHPTDPPVPLTSAASPNSALASPSSPTDQSSTVDIHALAVNFFAGVYDFNLDDCDRKATEFCDWYRTANLVDRDLSQCLASFLVESNSPNHD
ncbi:unnamed protein product, partial [Allacma fusca]